MLRKKNAIEFLQASNPMHMTVEERAAMTVSCSDCDDIPKAQNAGKVVTKNGQKVQIMHNGLTVLAGGYYGELIETIIKKLKGHHEPQEEKVFYELLKRIDGKNPTMIELGSFWAYYSLWFKSGGKNRKAICCEPDPKNIEVGKRNMALNGYTEGENLTFVQSAAGAVDGKIIKFRQDSDQTKVVSVPIRTVDSLVAEHKVAYLDILHVDAQGVELMALEGAINTIKQKKIRFMVISTHHYIFSGDPQTHQKCEAFIRDNGGHIVSSHGILESYSGDGLIVASFDARDRDFYVETSHNHGPALFRSYEEDLALLIAKRGRG